ncbi:MAG TPA: hypothetical protein VF796_05285 [Humisphaera sp.]
MDLPRRLTLTASQYYLDGGTTVLSGVDEAGRPRAVVLGQRVFPDSRAEFQVATPGRLHLDDTLVPIRSELESALLDLLRRADVRYEAPPEDDAVGPPISPNALILGQDIRDVLTRGPEENIRALRDQVIDFVASDAYLRFADRVEQAADPTRYTVRPAWDESNRQAVIVRLSRLRGVGVAAARAWLADGTPLAEGASATEVAKLAAKCALEGVTVRVDPPFRWATDGVAG